MNKNSNAEQLIRREVITAFENVLHAAARLNAYYKIERTDYERIKTRFIECYLEPLIRYMSSMEED